MELLDAMYAATATIFCMKVCHNQYGLPSAKAKYVHELTGSGWSRHSGWPRTGSITTFTKQGNQAHLFLTLLNGYQNWLQYKHKE